MNNKFLCNECQELTPLVTKQEKIKGDIRHDYAECQNCKAKVTIQYTDTKIRKLLKRQETTPSGPLKQQRSEKILQLEDELRKKVEAG
ncbi:hypothetical protein [Enterococcus larvae]|uniref:hypothetical protein n=1 Tax=Enterococcus larvae TaxID=2794352 RepID=UPI003F3B832F